MPFIHEIDKDKLTFKVRKDDISNAEYKYCDILHKFLHDGDVEDIPEDERRLGLFGQLNEALRTYHENTEGSILFEFVYDKHTEISEMEETRGKYHYDFHIEATTAGGETSTSLGYRISSSAKNADIHVQHEESGDTGDRGESGEHKKDG